MDIQIHPTFCFNEIGQRTNNEDSIYPPQMVNGMPHDQRVFLVCDGVGGLEKGEVASGIVCDVVSAQLALGPINKENINKAIAQAEVNMDTYVNDNQNAQGMATTMTLLVLGDEGVVAAHIGDSRIYQIRGDEIIFKTMDHSFVNELVSQNIITEEEAIVHPKRNVITKAIMGHDNHHDADVVNLADVRVNDYFFMCTDGVIESVKDDALVNVLKNPNMSNLEKMNWIKSECASNSKDNFSGYLLQIKEVVQ